MIDIAKATLRYRWASFVGAFIALALGTAMIGMMALTLAATMRTPFPGPQRFANAAEVVVPRGFGDDVLPAPAAVPAGVVARLTAAGPAVADRSFEAQTPEGPSGMTGHGWSAAGFADYHLTAGHAPTSADQIVLGGGAAGMIGRNVPVTTPNGTAQFRVVGVTNALWFEDAVFFTDAEAAQLSPPINALVLPAPTAGQNAAAAVVGNQALALTGDERTQADPDDSGGASELAKAQAMAGTTTGLAVCVSVFVVVATFAFAVEQRRRELALFRLIGATGKQVRRMVLSEAALVGLAAAAAGCVLAPFGAAPLRSWMVGHSVAPSWFHVGLNPIPLVIAFVLGVLAAVGGSAAVLIRVSFIRPVETMREANVERRGLTPVRLVLGIAMLAGAAVVGVVIARTTPYYAAKPRKYETVPVLYTLALAMLSPILLRPVTALLTGPLAGVKSAAGPLLVRQNVMTSRRRTAAVVTPIVIAVGLVGTMLAMYHSGDDTGIAQQRQEIQAGAVVMPGPAGAVDQATAAKVAAITGTVTTPVTQADIWLGAPDGTELASFTAKAVPTAAMGRTVTPKVEAGSLQGLTDNFLVVDDQVADEAPLHVGDKENVLLPTGDHVTLTVAAIIPRSPQGDDAYISSAHTAALPPNEIYIDSAGAPRGTITDGTFAAVHAAVRGTPARAALLSQFLANEQAQGDTQSNQAAVVILGVALAYALIAVGNTLVMAVSGRRREFAVLGLSGALRGQILRVSIAECVVAVVEGGLLAAIATALTGLTQRLALVKLAANPPVALPWLPVGETVAACAAVALGCAGTATWRATRQRAIEAVGIRE